MALIKCRECGKEISSEAPACPNCGRPAVNSPSTSPAASHSGKKKGSGCLSLIALVVVGTVVATYIGVNSENNSQSGITRVPAARSDRPVYKTTARALYRDYEANEVATDQRIGNSAVEVEGVIASIDKDFSDSAVIQLVTDNQFSHAGLTLVDSQKSLAGTLSRGQPIVIRCEKMTRIIGSPQGTNCTIVSK
jgi:predicted nuclease of predicted toxin-antitoxin system